LLVAVAAVIGSNLATVEMVAAVLVDWFKEHPYQFRHLPDPIQ
jgi:hypothetical protein